MAEMPEFVDAMRYGFDWTDAEAGESRLVVQRRARLPRSRVVGILTPKAELDVYVSPTGRLRLWLNGKEVPKETHG